MSSIIIKPASYPYKAYVILENGRVISGADSFHAALAIAAVYLGIVPVAVEA